MNQASHKESGMKNRPFLAYLIKGKQLASISLIVAIILPALSVLFITCFSLTERCLIEYSASRLLKAAGKVALASYSRDLWRSYGLWGIEQAEVKLDKVNASLNRLPERIVNSGISIEFSNPTLNPDQLQEQIFRYMKLRAPVILSSELIHRIRSAAEARASLDGGDIRSTIRGQHEADKAHANFQLLKPGLALLEDPSSLEIIRNEDPDLIIADAEEIELLLPFIKQFSKKLLPVYEALGSSESGEESFAPGSIENLAGKLDDLLDYGYLADLEKLCLTEYCLLYFTSASNIEKGLRSQKVLMTPDGRSLRDLAETRPFELEQIVSARSNIKEAQTYCDGLITGMRFIANYIAFFRTPSKQANYIRISKILAASIKVLSLGTLQVPEEAMKYLIQAVDALRQADKDLQDLKSGYGLYFWPSAAHAYSRDQFTMPKFYYRDYMRLGLMVQSPDKILEQISRLIEKDLPGEYYQRVRVGLDINRRSLIYDLALDFQD